MKSLRGHLAHLAEVLLECQSTEVTTCNSAVSDPQLSFLLSPCLLLDIFFFFFYCFYPECLAGLPHLAKWEVSHLFIYLRMKFMVRYFLHTLRKCSSLDVFSHFVNRSPLKLMFSSAPTTTTTHTPYSPTLANCFKQLV